MDLMGIIIYRKWDSFGKSKTERRNKWILRETIKDNKHAAN